MKTSPTRKKKKVLNINKSTKYYIICGGLAVLLILLLLLLYALLAHIDILAWFHTKYFYIVLGAIAIYVVIGGILLVKDKIGRM